MEPHVPLPPREIGRRNMLKILALAPWLPWPAAGYLSSRAAPMTFRGQQQPPVPQPSPLADAMTEVVRIRYGKDLSPAQLTDIKSIIAGKLRASERLRSFKLQNGEEPDFVFRA